MFPAMSTATQDAAERGPAEAAKTEHGARPAGVHDFVCTHFAVRRNVVKVWRGLPHDLWTGLVEPDDLSLSRRRQRQAVIGVALIAIIFVVWLSGVGLRTTVAWGELHFPLLGKSLTLPTDAATGSGWYFLPGQSVGMVLWVVSPPILGWAFVRLLWIRAATKRSPYRPSTLAMARHLGSVYLYIYVVLLAGAAIMAPLILLSPQGTHTLRWWSWLVLFGETFFVPALMWSRLVRHDTSGQVFGPHRYAVLILYGLLFVVIPIGGMTQYLD